MGDPRKLKKKFSGPGHPWEANRIKDENRLLNEYGLVKKKEIWRARSLLSKWNNQARKIVSLPDAEREKAEGLLVAKLSKVGLVKKDARLDDVLALTVRDILDRRLQTQLYKQGFTSTVKQSRQFIIHQKVLVDGKKITSPTFLVAEGSKLRFIEGFAPSITKTIELKSKEKPVEAVKAAPVAVKPKEEI